MHGRRVASVSRAPTLIPQLHMSWSAGGPLQSSFLVEQTRLFHASLTHCAITVIPSEISIDNAVTPRGSVPWESFRTGRPCYHARRMKVEKRKFDQALAKLLRAKPEPRKKIKTRGRRGAKTPILAKP
jgi:hypothetical protein